MSLSFHIEESGRSQREITFEQRPAGGEEVSPIGIWGRALEGRGSGGYQGPKVGVCLRSEEETGMAEDSESFEMSARRKKGRTLRAL